MSISQSSSSTKSSLRSKSSLSVDSTKRPSKLWWLLANIVLVVCVLIQLPMLWVTQRVMPDSPYLQWVSGNLWQGSATWQLPQATSQSTKQSAPTNKPSLNGDVVWQWQPLKLFLGKVSLDIKVNTGKTHLTGELNVGLNSWQLQGLSGRIHQETLASFVNWQLPDAPIQVNNVRLDFNKSSGFDKVDGQLTWVGGQLGYPNAGQIYQADLSTEDKDKQKVLHAHLVNQENKALGDFYIDKQGMLDISLTQRLLENMPNYQGSAPKDTPVVSVRQPIGSLNE